MPTPDSASSNEWLQWVFFAVAALCLLYQITRGWQRGVMRQLVYLVALLLAYPVAWFAGPMMLPALRPLGFPDFVLSAVGGSALAFVVFVVVSVLGAILFKKTSQQEVRIIRWGYGVSGASLGLVSGLIFVWGMLLGVRLLGTMAESEVAVSRIAAEKRLSASGQSSLEEPTVRKPGGVVLSIAQMKHSLDHGAAGPVIKQVDPVPQEVYDMIGKATAVVANPESASRFLNYPGAEPIISHPKVLALRDDPAIVRQAKARDFMGLMKNERLVAVANDPEVQALLKKFEFQKALDYALDTPQKDGHANSN